MKNGICLVAFIPVRKEPNERSEMVTQLLFGEKYEILTEGPKFNQIRIFHDDYPGYISRECTSFIKDDFKNDFEDTIYLSSLYVLLKDHNNNCNLIISGGSELPKNSEYSLTFQVNGYKYSLVSVTNFNCKQNIFDLAKLFLGSPYLWGGKTFMGIDCSGLVQTVYKMKGFSVPRDASQQINLGNNISFKNIKKGDLAFFQNPEGKITHVGILDGEGNIIHSSGRVKIEKFVKEGIVIDETEEPSHNLHSIKRL